MDNSFKKDDNSKIIESAIKDLKGLDMQIASATKGHKCITDTMYVLIAMLEDYNLGYEVRLEDYKTFWED